MPSAATRGERLSRVRDQLAAEALDCVAGARCAADPTPQPMPRPNLRPLAALVVSVLLPFTTASLPAQVAPAPLSQSGTEALVGRFGQATHWMQKVVLLLSLNQYWHPSGAAMVAAALRDKDERLRAFGVEALLRSEEALLPAVATTELLDELIQKQAVVSNDRYRERVMLALQRLVPDAGATDKVSWQRWWREHKETHQPAPWTERAQPDASGGGTAAVAQRAFDLYQDGLDLMICIDSTGSMQPTIDALGESLTAMVDILDGVSPKLRIGIVHYKDYGDLGKEGAKVVLPLTKSIKKAVKELEDLRAYGGGDLPEAVLGGLELALSKAMKWQPDANKLTIVIGDAPAHPDEVDKCVALVKLAHDNPGAQDQKSPTTGPKSTDKPFLTSAIGVFLDLPEKYRKDPGYQQFADSQQQMKQQFAAIAKAGGGVFVDVTFKVPDEDPKDADKKAKGKGKDAPKGGAASAAVRAIVEHILVLSFGERFQQEMKDFVRIFFEYRDAGFID